MPTPKADKFWLFVLLALGLLLRLQFIAEPLWYDESYTQWIVGLPLGRMMQALAGDVHPPLHYLFLWLGGPHPITMRLLSVSFSLVNVCLLWLLLENLQFPHIAQVVACALMAIAPLQVAYGTEARMYAQLEFWVLAGAWALAKWMEDTESNIGPVLGLVFAGVGMVYTHNYGWLYFGALLVSWLVTSGIIGHYPVFSQEWRKNVIEKFLVVGVLGGTVLLAYLPWAAALAGQAGNFAAGHWLWVPTAGDVVEVLGQMVFVKVQASPWVGLLVVLAGLLLAGLLAVWALRRVVLARTVEPRVALLLWLFAAPFCAALAISWLWHPIFMLRPLVAISPFFYALLALAFADLPKLGRWAVVSGAVPVFIILAAYSPRAALVQRNHTADVLATIQQHWQAGDVVLHTALTTRVELNQYLASDVQYLVRPADDGLGWGLTLTTREAMGMAYAEPGRLPEGTGRVFLVLGYLPGSAGEHAAEALLKQYPHRELAHWQEPLATVYVYQLWRHR